MALLTTLMPNAERERRPSFYLLRLDSPPLPLRASSSRDLSADAYKSQSVVEDREEGKTGTKKDEEGRGGGIALLNASR